MGFYFSFFILSVFIKTALTEDIKDLNFKQLVQLVQDTSHLTVGDVKDNDVKFFLFTRSLKEGKLLTNETDIDSNKSAKIIVHGWLANNRRAWYKEVTEGFLKNGDFNVIQVDWERPARSAYVSSAINTKLIGQKIAKFVLDAKIPPEKVHMVGHSLGAHIAGFAAKQIYQEAGERVSRISGLDPAGPYFQEHILDKDERLDREDADVVNVIHTDAGVYGIAFPIGTLDVFVNGGRAPQPGCSYDVSVNSVGGLIEKSFCSHASSITYFTEWIGGGKFRCKLCNSWTFSLINLCLKTVDLKEEDVNDDVTGVCITKTRPVKPFLEH